ncbi:MAG TPA: IclR family transcriptional regulator [Bryobacteraceae bacterium]|jgi:DNA-binding IclR family transcriptional regulator|nr:IclR family transcriptional regulator [Bryobacteraceae bacterium]
MAKNGAAPYEIQSLQRGLGILTLLAESENGLSATAIARAARLHTSTVHRFLINLEQAGYLHREINGIYRLGPRCISLGQSALKQLDVRRVSYSTLEELNRVTRETVHLIIRDHADAVYIDKFESLEPLRTFSRVGARVPLHCTAAGKILLAFMDPLAQCDLLENIELTRFTPNTVCSLKAFKDQLASVKRLGYGQDNEEHEPNIRCIAAPIWDAQGEVTAAFSVTAPSMRMPRSRVRELIPLLRGASLTISKRLGYDPIKQAAL